MTKLAWQSFATQSFFSLRRVALAPLRLYVAGPCDQLLILARNQVPLHSITRFDERSPKHEFLWIKAGEGTMHVLPASFRFICTDMVCSLLPTGTEYMLIVAPPNYVDPQAVNHQFLGSLTICGHFLTARGIIDLCSMMLHSVMLKDKLKNQEYWMWEVLVRVCAFWIDVSLTIRKQDRHAVRCF